MFHITWVDVSAWDLLKGGSRFVIEKLTERDDDSVGGLCFHTIEQDLLPVEKRKIRSVV